MSDDEERVTKPFKFVTGKQPMVQASGQQLTLYSWYVLFELFSSTGAPRILYRFHGQDAIASFHLKFKGVHTDYNHHS